jgi:hypothetical protein
MRHIIPIVFVAATVVVGCHSPSMVQTKAAAPDFGAQTPTKLASRIKWDDIFGSSAADTNSAFSLMAHGAFRAESTNVQNVVGVWLKDHPNAVVISILTYTPLVARFPSSRLACVWVVDGNDNVNVELVRRGCFAPETQLLNPDEKPEVSQKDYEAFARRIIKAGESAKEEKIGIWR